jgi:hypothetical protein
MFPIHPASCTNSNRYVTPDKGERYFHSKVSNVLFHSNYGYKIEEEEEEKRKKKKWGSKKQRWKRERKQGEEIICHLYGARIFCVYRKKKRGET